MKHLLSMVAGCANIAAAAPDGGKANLDRGAATCATLCNVNRFCKSEHLVQTVHFCSLCNLCSCVVIRVFEMGSGGLLSIR